jgi:hypothetical protein
LDTPDIADSVLLAISESVAITCMRPFSRLRLSARGYHEKAAENRAVALHNSTDFECVRFRENADFTGISERGALK